MELQNKQHLKQIISVYFSWIAEIALMHRQKTVTKKQSRHLQNSESEIHLELAILYILYYLRNQYHSQFSFEQPKTIFEAISTMFKTNHPIVWQDEYLKQSSLNIYLNFSRFQLHLNHTGQFRSSLFQHKFTEIGLKFV